MAIGLELREALKQVLIDHIPSTAKNSYTSAMDSGGSTSSTGGSRIKKNQNTGKVKDIIGARDAAGTRLLVSCEVSKMKRKQ
nr:hypothetical protein CFP56_62318 [Quercus suber]